MMNISWSPAPGEIHQVDADTYDDAETYDRLIGAGDILSNGDRLEQAKGMAKGT
jgi:hypothetical protein